jgi:hypothetical protein
LLRSLRSLCPSLTALAAMFAGEPPSSSNPTKRSRRRIGSFLDAIRRLLLQIGGANIAAADRALESADFVVVRQGRTPLSPLQERMYTFVPTAMHTLQRERSERSERIRSFQRWVEGASPLSPSTLPARARGGWRSSAAAFLTRVQTNDVSARSLVQDSRAPAWLCSPARDSGLIAPLAPRGSRCEAASFVVPRGRGACPLASPHHGGARSGFDCSLVVPGGNADRRGCRSPALSQHFQSQEERLDALCSVNCLQCANRGA